MKRSSKHSNITTLTVEPSGGVNLGDWPANIGANELTRAYNMMYLPHSQRLATRPAVRCQSTTAHTSAIERLHAYEDGTNSILVGYSNGQLMQWSGGWTNINAVAKAPALLNFNSKLLVADGTGIYSWDGTTWATVTTTIKPDALAEVANRVVANHVDEPDSVYFSGPEDETDWDTEAGAAVGIRAGFGDLMNVNAFQAWAGTDLIVSKRGQDVKSLYRINVTGTPANWSAYRISGVNAALNNEVMLAASNNLYWYDDTFVSLRGTQEYGDLTVDVVLGRRIADDVNSRQLTMQSLTFLPDYAAILCLTDTTRHYLYSPYNNAFTELEIPCDGLTCCASSGGTTYLAGANGHLYALNASYGADSPTTTSEVDITSVVRSKSYDITTAEGILRRITASVTALVDCETSLEIYGDAMSRKATLETGSLNTSSANTELYDANNELNAATYPLSGLETSYITSRNRFRSSDFAFQLRTFGGRVVINRFDAQIAAVNG